MDIVFDLSSSPVSKHVQCYSAERPPSLRPPSRRSTAMHGGRCCWRCRSPIIAPHAPRTNTPQTHGRLRAPTTHTGSLRGSMRGACCAAACCAAMPPVECPGMGCGSSRRPGPAAGRGTIGVLGAWVVAGKVAACAGADHAGIGGAKGGAGAVDVDEDMGKGAVLPSGGVGSCRTQRGRLCVGCGCTVQCCRRSCTMWAWPRVVHWQSGTVADACEVCVAAWSPCLPLARGVTMWPVRIRMSVLRSDFLNCHTKLLDYLLNHAIHE